MIVRPTLVCLTQQLFGAEEQCHLGPPEEQEDGCVICVGGALLGLEVVVQVEDLGGLLGEADLVLHHAQAQGGVQLLAPRQQTRVHSHLT